MGHATDRSLMRRRVTKEQRRAWGVSPWAFRILVGAGWLTPTARLGCYFSRSQFADQLSVFAVEQPDHT